MLFAWFFFPPKRNNIIWQIFLVYFFTATIPEASVLFVEFGALQMSDFAIYYFYAICAWKCQAEPRALDLYV